MITNDYLHGYIAALNTIEENVDNRIGFGHTNIYYDDLDLGLAELKAVKQHIQQIRESYKQLVKELNAT